MTERVVRLEDLTSDQRRLVLALVSAGKSSGKERDPAMVVIAEPETQSDTRNYRFEYVRGSDLKIDPSYHAPERFTEKHARKLGVFDETKVGIITCSFRDGIMRLIDGNHRRWLAMEAGVEYLYAKVFFGLVQQEEARVFRGLSNQLPLNGIDLWQTRRIEGDPVAVGVENILSHYGIRLARGKTNSPRVTKSVSTLERIYSVDPGLLNATLGLIRTVWPEQTRGLDAVILQSIASFTYVYSRTNPSYKPDRLEERLLLAGPEQVHRSMNAVRAAEAGKYGTGTGGTAKVGVIGWTVARRALLGIYNTGLRHKLPDITMSDMRTINDGRVVDFTDRLS